MRRDTITNGCALVAQMKKDAAMAVITDGSEPTYELPIPLSTAGPLPATLARHHCQRGGVDATVAVPPGD